MAPRRGPSGESGSGMHVQWDVEKAGKDKQSGLLCHAEMGSSERL